MLVLGLYVQDNNIQNNSRLKQNFRFVYCCLKNISLHGIGAGRDTKCQNVFMMANISKTKRFFEPI